MVRLDHALIVRAGRLITGANVHRAREMIFFYEQAVLLHNKGLPSTSSIRTSTRKRLRRFVEEESRRWPDFPQPH